MTSGQLTVAWDDPNFFAFFGPDGFALSALFFGASSPQQTCFTGCLPGTIVNLSAVAGGSGPGFTLGLSTHAIVNGVDLIGEPAANHLLDLAGTLRFDAPDVVLPPLKDVEGRGFAVSAPFLFEGNVAGFARDDPGGLAPVFQLALDGTGTASLHLSKSEDGVYGQPEVTYTFAATPEPTTLALFSTGLVGFAARIWTRKKQQRPAALAR